LCFLALPVQFGFAPTASSTLRTSPERLDGKPVTVTGTLERRAGVKINERWMVVVTSLKGRQ